MTNIEQKALALLNAIQAEHDVEWPSTALGKSDMDEALCRAIEQHEAFRQEVSDAVTTWWLNPPILFQQFIIPAPKPDPLVGIIGELDDGTWGETKAEYADRFRAALDALGYEIREKNDDN